MSRYVSVEPHYPCVRCLAFKFGSLGSRIFPCLYCVKPLHSFPLHFFPLIPPPFIPSPLFLPPSSLSVVAGVSEHADKPVVAKRYSAARVIPLMMLGFGTCSLCTAAVTNFGGIFALRFLLGVFESPMSVSAQ